MKILLIVLAFFGVESTVMNLSVTLDGLVGEIGGLGLFLFNTETSHGTLHTHIVRSDSERLYLFPLGPQSADAEETTSRMILPPSESHPYFHMIVNPIDPRSYCFERQIGIAEMTMGVAVEFAASVALIPNGHNSSRLTSMEEAAAPRQYLFQLSTVSLFDVIPRDIYETLLAEIARLGVETAEDENINLLPNIEYTVYHIATLDNAVARIVAKPCDYLEFTPIGMRLMVQPNSGWFGPYKLGINTLKHIGVLIDYQNHQIGFFEPL